jgi:hypothetical protein
MKIFSGLLLALCCNLIAGTAQAFDADKAFQNIKEARRLSAPGAGVAPAMAAPPTEADKAKKDQDAVKAVDREEEAKLQVFTTCAGRFGVLSGRLEKAVSRSEQISIVGGVAGMLGAVATCPHCSALLAGIAGIANPFQKVFADNLDSPQDIRGELSRLSDKINADLKAYTALPAAIPGTATFDANLSARLDKLYEVSASCAFYDTFAKGVTNTGGNASGGK